MSANSENAGAESTPALVVGRLAAAMRPRLRTVVLAANLLVLLLPVGAVLALKLIETETLRRTQAELRAQAVIIAPLFQSALASVRAEWENAGLIQEFTGGAPAANQIHETTLPPLDRLIDPILPAYDLRESPGRRADRVASEAGRRIGVAVRAAARGSGAAILLTDAAGIVVARSSGQTGLSAAHLEEVRAALAGQAASRLRFAGDNGPAVTIALPVPAAGGDGAILMQRTPPPLSALMVRHQTALISAAAVLVVLVLMISLSASILVTGPVTRLVRQAREVAGGRLDGSAPISRPGTREIAELSEQVVAMSDQLRRRADYIRDFAYHVSHEFKTPLTSMEGALELLRDHFDEMEPDRRKTFLSNISKDVDRLRELVSQLLELARADVVRPSGQNVSLSEVLTRLRERFKDGDGVVTDLTPGVDPTLIMAPESCHSILLNLCDNAVQHGAANVRIETTYSDRSASATISISDDGPGIPSGDVDKIFQPFFTTRRDSSGTGLGLPIVRALIDGHGGSIRLLPSLKGACFQIELPARIGTN